MKTAYVTAIATASLCFAQMQTTGAFTLRVDPAPLSIAFDTFNDGIDTSTNHSNMAAAGEAGGVSSVTMPAGASDPQFQYPTPGAPFDADTYPYLRVNSRGSVGGGSQVFPLPPAAATVLNYSTATDFAESQLQFVQPVNGNGLRIDPLGGGTAVTETFDYDYIMLDRFPTIGLAEFDRDGALDGWTVVGNGHIINGATSSSTSTFAATTSGVDPIMQRGGLNIDASAFGTVEVRIALDPASNSRFEMFWDTSTFPGPVGGQSVVLTSELIRDGNLHTYRIDMSDEAAWNGTLELLRIDPLADGDAAAGRSFAIDYVRLMSGAPIPEPSSLLLLLGGLAAISLRRRRG